MAFEDKTRVVGYFAISPPMNAVCDGDACVIAGSEQAMKTYLTKLESPSNTAATIRKTRFGEILEGMMRGGAYAFDEESYNRFYPLALKAGLNVGPEDFSTPGPVDMHFVRIAIDPNI